MNLHEAFIQQIKEHGAGHVLAGSFEEAKQSEKQFLVVVIPEKDTGWCSVYLTGKINGVFGEFTSWDESEFQEEPSLMDVAFAYIKEAYVHEDVEKAMYEFNDMIEFFPYE